MAEYGKILKMNWKLTVNSEHEVTNEYCILLTLAPSYTVRNLAKLSQLLEPMTNAPSFGGTDVQGGPKVLLHWFRIFILRSNLQNLIKLYVNVAHVCRYHCDFLVSAAPSNGSRRDLELCKKLTFFGTLGSQHFSTLENFGSVNWIPNPMKLGH